MCVNHLKRGNTKEEYNIETASKQIAQLHFTIQAFTLQDVGFLGLKLHAWVGENSLSKTAAKISFFEY